MHLPIKNNFPQKAKAFTLIELLVVISIIAILTGAATVVYTKVRVGVRNNQRVIQMQKIATALERYHLDHGTYPKTGSGGSYYGQGGEFQSAQCYNANESYCCLLGGTWAQNMNLGSPDPNAFHCPAPYNEYLPFDTISISCANCGRAAYDVLEGGIKGNPAATIDYGSDGQTYAVTNRYWEGTPPGDFLFSQTVAPYYWCEAVDWSGGSSSWTHTYVFQSKTVKTPTPPLPGGYLTCT